MKITFEAGEIVVRIPYQTGGDYPKSGSGKSRMIESTKGFVAVDGCDPDVRIGVNAIKLIPKGER